MTTHKYAFQGFEKEKMAKAVGRDLPISTKQSIEICSFIRGKNLQKAKELLLEVIRMKTPVPFRRFTEGAGHKKGNIASGRYPMKASNEILNLLNSLEANAQQKGLDTSNLVLKHLCANQASRPPRYGRIRGRTAKRSHIEIVAVESERKQKHTEKKSDEKQEMKKDKKPEEKPKESKTPEKKKDEVKKEVKEIKTEAKKESPKEPKKEAAKIKPEPRKETKTDIPKSKKEKKSITLTKTDKKKDKQKEKTHPKVKK